MNLQPVPLPPCIASLFIPTFLTIPQTIQLDPVFEFVNLQAYPIWNGWLGVRCFVMRLIWICGVLRRLWRCRKSIFVVLVRCRSVSGLSYLGGLSDVFVIIYDSSRCITGGAAGGGGVSELSAADYFQLFGPQRLPQCYCYLLPPRDGVSVCSDSGSGGGLAEHNWGLYVYRVVREQCFGEQFGYLHRYEH